MLLRILHRLDPCVNGIPDALRSSTIEVALIVVSLDLLPSKVFRDHRAFHETLREIRFFVNEWVLKTSQSYWLWNTLSNEHEVGLIILCGHLGLWEPSYCVPRKLAWMETGPKPDSLWDLLIGLVVSASHHPLPTVTQLLGGFSGKGWMFHDSLRWSE